MIEYCLAKCQMHLLLKLANSPSVVENELYCFGQLWLDSFDLELEKAEIFPASSYLVYLALCSGLCGVVWKELEPNEPLKIFEHYSSLVYPAFFWALLSLPKSPGSIGYRAYLLWAFHQVQAFELGWVPVPALLWFIPQSAPYYFEFDLPLPFLLFWLFKV